MLKLKIKYVLSICIFLVAGMNAVFGAPASFHSYKATSPGFYIFTGGSSESQFFYEDVPATTKLDELRKQATFERNDDLIEAEEYEEISSLRKSAENPELFAAAFYTVSRSFDLHYRHFQTSGRNDDLYPGIDRYILLQVFRI